MRAVFGLALEPGAPGFWSETPLPTPVRKQSCTWAGGVPTPPNPPPGQFTLFSCTWPRPAAVLSAESQFPLPQNPRHLEGGDKETANYKDRAAIAAFSEHFLYVGASQAFCNPVLTLAHTCCCHTARLSHLSIGRARTEKSQI